MIRKIRHKGLRPFHETGTVRGIQPQHAGKLRLLLTMLNAANEPEDMNAPGLRLHKLKGELKDWWSVDVDGNYRLIFKMQGDTVTEVDYRDTH